MSEAALLAAHATGDWAALVTLYLRAADARDGDARAFFLTQAWVYALDSGDDRAEALRQTLIELGRA